MGSRSNYLKTIKGFALYSNDIGASFARVFQCHLITEYFGYNFVFKYMFNSFHSAELRVKTVNPTVYQKLFLHS